MIRVKMFHLLCTDIKMLVNAKEDRRRLYWLEFHYGAILLERRSGCNWSNVKSGS